MKKIIFLSLALLGSAAFAADTKISDYPAASTLGGTEAIPAAQGGATKKITPAQITTYVKGTLVKGDVGLGNVDNTSDATKNAATATLTNKTLTTPAITSPTGLVKADVGLGNVDNTSDATKNSAGVTLTNKTLTSPAITTPTGLVKSDVGLGNVDNTSDTTKNAATVALTNKTINGSSNTLTNIGNSALSSGAVTDDKASLETKPSVGLVATSNLTLSGVQTVDNVIGTAGQTLVLATAQTTGSQNGPWVMQSGAWTRPSWYPSGGTTQGIQFSTTLVRLGTAYQGTIWRLTTAAPITVDTTTTAWTRVLTGSQSLSDLYPSPSASDRVAVVGPTAGNESSYALEPNVWYTPGCVSQPCWNMLYTSGSSSSVLAYAYASAPTGPWTKVGTAIGNGTGGATAGQFVSHNGMYIEGSTIYILTSVSPNSGSLLLFSASISFTPASGPSFSQIGAIMSLPSGYNAWGNIAVVPVTVGSSYALLVEARNTSTTMYQIGLATASGAISSGPTFTATTFPLTQLTSTIKHWGSTAGVQDTGGAFVAVEGSSVVMIYHAGPLGTTPNEMFRASSPISDLVNWTSLDNGGAWLTRRSRYEVDQTGDASVACSPIGDCWLFSDAVRGLESTADILATPLLRGNVLSTSYKSYLTRPQLQAIGQRTFSPITLLGTGVTSYTASNADDIQYNLGVNNLTVTAPRANAESFFRISAYNALGTGKKVTVTINGGDNLPAGGCGTVYAGQSVTYYAPNKNWWTCTSGSVIPAATRVITASGGITGALSDKHICVNKTTGAASAVTLPANPYTGFEVTVDDCKGDAATNNITITPVSGNLDGSANFVVTTNYGSWTGYYTGSIWKTTASK